MRRKRGPVPGRLGDRRAGGTSSGPQLCSLRSSADRCNQDLLGNNRLAAVARSRHKRPVPLPWSACLLGRQNAAPHLVELDTLEQGLEVAFTEPLVAFALDELEEDRPQLVL